MHSIDNFGGFVVAILIFQMIPGPGSLNILRATARHGTRAGFAAMAGTLLGGLLCMLAAASGLEAVFRGQPKALQALQVGGSLYLAWLGWRLLAAEASVRTAGVDAAPSLFLHLRQALLVSLSNPKVLLFYFALLPLFLRAPVTAEADHPGRVRDGDQPRLPEPAGLRGRRRRAAPGALAGLARGGAAAGGRAARRLRREADAELS